MKRDIFQGEDVPFALNFKTGSDLSITDFSVFDSVKIEVKCVNYPTFEIENIDIKPLQIKGNISNEITSQLFGNLFLILTFTKGENVYKNRIATTLNITKP